MKWIVSDSLFDAEECLEVMFIEPQAFEVASLNEKS